MTCCADEGRSSDASNWMEGHVPSWLAFFLLSLLYLLDTGLPAVLALGLGFAGRDAGGTGSMICPEQTHPLLSQLKISVTILQILAPAIVENGLDLLHMNLEKVGKIGHNLLAMLEHASVHRKNHTLKVRNHLL